MAAAESDRSQFHCQSLARTSRLLRSRWPVRRHAYTVDVMGRAAGLNYVSDYRNVDGIVVPTKRRVYAPDGNKQKISEPVLMAIDIRDIAFTAD